MGWEFGFDRNLDIGQISALQKHQFEAVAFSVNDCDVGARHRQELGEIRDQRFVRAAIDGWSLQRDVEMRAAILAVNAANPRSFGARLYANGERAAFRMLAQE